MGDFYVDETIHDNGAFIIAACVYSNESLQKEMDEIFQRFEQDPTKFEYKSSANYAQNSLLINFRSALKNLLIRKCKIGLVILPITARQYIAAECIKAIGQFIKANELNLPITVYLDQGMLKINHQAKTLIAESKQQQIELILEADSKNVKGIQLADLSARVAAIQLKGYMGLVRKIVKVKVDSIYDEFELTFEMFAALRNAFFTQIDKIYDPDEVITNASTLIVEPYGLYISNYCDNKLKEAARAQFSKVYLGCIH